MLDKLIRCPYCKESYYAYLYSITLAVYRQPVFKDGKCISDDDDLTTEFYQCLNCGKEFSSKNAISEDLPKNCEV